MVLFVVTLLVYVVLLISIRADPTSLKSKRITFIENLKQIKGSLYFGVFLIIVFYCVTKGSFEQVDESVYGYLSLKNESQSPILWPFQAFSSLLIHINFIHFISNLTGIGVMSVYERRVGSKRYFTVLIFSSIFSVFSIFFHPYPIAICGISGGVFGLVAAHFTDNEEFSLSAWIRAALFFGVLFVFVSLKSLYQDSSTFGQEIQIDYIGHLLGALSSIIFCRLYPLSRSI